MGRKYKTRAILKTKVDADSFSSRKWIKQYWLVSSQKPLMLLRPTTTRPSVRRKEKKSRTLSLLTINEEDDLRDRYGYKRTDDEQLMFPYHKSRNGGKGIKMSSGQTGETWTQRAHKQVGTRKSWCQHTARLTKRCNWDLRVLGSER